VVDLEERCLAALFGGAIDAALPVLDLSLLVVGNGIWLDPRDKNGMRWRTGRISWDGIWDLRMEKDKVKGESWSPIDDSSYSFSVYLNTGAVEGGYYDGPPVPGDGCAT
jgi:hypothetical protein